MWQRKQQRNHSVHARGCAKLLKCFILSGATLAALFLFANQTFAQQNPDKGWKGRFWVGVAGRYVLTDNETFEDPTFGTIETSVSGSAFTFGGDVEYLFTKWLGLDFALAYTNFPLEFQHSVGEGVQEDDLGVVPFLIALNFHVVNNERLDFWLGPQVGYIFFGSDVAFVVPDVGVHIVETSNTFSPMGFDIGADVKVSDDWAVNIAFRWQNADASDEILVDPTLITVGVTGSF